MSIDEIKRAMQADMDAPMHYLFPPRLKQMLLDEVPGCSLLLDGNGDVVFVEPDNTQTTLYTEYRDAETRKRFARVWREENERQSL